MAEVRKLVLVPSEPIPDAKAQLLERFDEDIKKMREWLEHTTAAGYALVGYDNRIDDDGRPALQTWVNFWLHNPADGFWLPDAVKVRVHQRIHD